MADDTIRMLKGKSGSEVIATLEKWVYAALSRWEDLRNGVGMDCYIAVFEFWRNWAANIKGETSEKLVLRGRETMEDLEWVVSAVLLVDDSIRDGDGVAWEVAKR